MWMCVIQCRSSPSDAGNCGSHCAFTGPSSNRCRVQLWSPCWKCRTHAPTLPKSATPGVKHTRRLPRRESHVWSFHGFPPSLVWHVWASRGNQWLSKVSRQPANDFSYVPPAASWATANLFFGGKVSATAPDFRIRARMPGNTQDFFLSCSLILLESAAESAPSVLNESRPERTIFVDICGRAAWFLDLVFTKRREVGQIQDGQAEGKLARAQKSSYSAWTSGQQRQIARGRTRLSRGWIEVESRLNRG